MKHKSDETPEFKIFWEDIWRAHARHTDGRGLARDAFVKHIRNGADPQDIIDGARYFFRSMKDKDREFVPLSATWINRMSYEDLAALERAYQLRVGAGNSNVAQSNSEREAYIAAELRRSARSFT
jgi:hypothetical protein